MIKKIITIIIVFCVLGGTFWLLSQPPAGNIDNSSNTPNTSESVTNPDLVYYWGDGCPHCETVKKWITENNQEGVLKIESKEVYKNDNNAKELLSMVEKYCPDLKQNFGVGVPIALDPVGLKCLQGSEEIIEFLTNKLAK